MVDDSRIISAGPEEWDALLAGNPKILWGVVADIVKAVKASEGERRTGRRPSVGVRSVDELYSVLFPVVHCGEPFPLALRLALGERSQRRFAADIGFNQATVSRLLSGKAAPTPETMERIAHNLGLAPTYFAEYRALKIGQIITDVLMAHPEVTAEFARRISGVEA